MSRHTLLSLPPTVIPIFRGFMFSPLSCLARVGVSVIYAGSRSRTIAQHPARFCAITVTHRHTFVSVFRSTLFLAVGRSIAPAHHEACYSARAPLGSALCAHLTVHLTRPVPHVTQVYPAPIAFQAGGSLFAGLNARHYLVSSHTYSVLTSATSHTALTLARPALTLVRFIRVEFHKALAARARTFCRTVRT